MAKNDRNSPDQGRVKLRVIEFEYDGSNPSILESIRSLASTMSRGNGGREAMKRVASNGGSNHVALNGEVIDEQSDDVEDSNESEVIAEAPITRKRAKARPPKLELLNLDFAGANGVSLKDFVQGVELSSQTKKMTIVASWLKHNLNKEEVTLDELYSCYRHLGWNDFSTNPRSVCHDLVHKEKYRWFESGKTNGCYTVSFVGDQKVEEWRKQGAK